MPAPPPEISEPAPGAGAPDGGVPVPSPGAALDPTLRAWLRPLFGEVSLVRALVGGITGEMLHLRRDGGGSDLVVRRWHGTQRWRQDMVRREADGLRALAGTDLPLPTLLAVDPDGARTGRPSTVTTFLPGEVELAPRDLRPWVRQLASMLARIHAVPPPEIGPCELWASSDLGWLTPDASGRPNEERTPGGDLGLAREALDLAADPGDPAATVLSHGDYQHFNVLWQRERISAVVDWPTVGLANRGLDVGHCRLNLAVLFSAEAAMWLLEDYEQLAGVRVDPGPDLQRLLNFGPNWPEFIQLQVAGRAPVDGPGMAGRVRETIARTLRRAG